jgi:hypothetical protein
LSTVLQIIVLPRAKYKVTNIKKPNALNPFITKNDDVYEQLRILYRVQFHLHSRSWCNVVMNPRTLP